MSETRPILAGAGVGGPVRARTLIFIRWVAIAGQLSALVFAQVGLGIPLPMDAALAAIVASVIVNLASAWGSSSASRLTDNEAALSPPADSPAWCLTAPRRASSKPADRLLVRENRVQYCPTLPRTGRIGNAVETARP